MNSNQQQPEGLGSSLSLPDRYVPILTPKVSLRGSTSLVSIFLRTSAASYWKIWVRREYFGGVVFGRDLQEEHVVLVGVVASLAGAHHPPS